MKKRTILFTASVVFQSLFTGCHTSRQYASQKSSEEPKFIDNVYVDHGHKTTPIPYTGENSTKAPNSSPVADKTGYTVYHPDPAASKKTYIPWDAADNDSKETYSKRETKEVRRKYADILGVKTKDISNLTLYEFIDKWYGANYKLGGKDEAGIDCSGFAQKLYGDVYGVDISRTAKEQFSDSKHIKRIKKAEEGDLVFFHVNSRRITHVGIYLANNYFVHASTSQGVIISSLNEDYWHKYFAGAGRVN